MTKEDKIILLHFTARTGMFIPVQDKNNIISFITGFETGSSTCNYTEPLEMFISQTFNIQLGSGGWHGQIDKLSKILSIDWVTTFKKMTLEIITNSETDLLKNELNKILKPRIKSLFSRINEQGDPWFNESWTKDWLSFCSLKSNWFKQMWTADEFKIISAIDEEIRADRIFANKELKIPTTLLVILKDEYKKLEKV